MAFLQEGPEGKKKKSKKKKNPFALWANPQLILGDAHILPTFQTIFFFFFFCHFKRIFTSTPTI